MNPPKYDEAVRLATENLSSIAGIRMLILYGSVSRGTATEKSDVDLAIVVKDELQRRIEPLGDHKGTVTIPSGRYGFPTELVSSVKRGIKRVQETVPGIKFDIPFIFEEEYMEGYEIGSGSINNPPDVLNDVGVVLFDNYN